MEVYYVMEYEEFVKELSQLDNESYELVVKLIERLRELEEKSK